MRSFDDTACTLLVVLGGDFQPRPFTQFYTANRYSEHVDSKKSQAQPPSPQVCSACVAQASLQGSCERISEATCFLREITPRGSEFRGDFREAKFISALLYV